MGKNAQVKRQRKARSTNGNGHPPNRTNEIDTLLGLNGGSGGPVHGSVLDPRAARQNATVQIQIALDTYVVARRIDMTSMIFEGLMPMPLLNAVQKMKEMKDMPAELRVAAMTDPENPDILDMLRRHAAAVVIEPKVVWPDDSDEAHMPANLLTLPQLLKIWNETALVPSVTPSAAFRFRQRPAVVPAPAVPAREAVRPEAEQLDQDTFIHG